MSRCHDVYRSSIEGEGNDERLVEVESPKEGFSKSTRLCED